MVRWLRSLIALAMTATPLSLVQGVAPRPPTDLSTLATQMDARLGEAVRSRRTSAAVAAIVQGDRVLLLKGYGWEDATRRRPIDPGTSRFGVASISKTFTALGVAQLLKQGSIASLDDPAGKYLTDLRLPEWRGTPITLRHLATHTAGLDESAWGAATPAPVGKPWSVADLQGRIPLLYRRPGTLSAYSNIGVDLLGHVIERVSGATYEDYITRHVFAPLGMRRASFVDRTAENVVRPFDPVTGKEGLVFADVPTAVPSGGIVASAADMAAYMRALLKADLPELDRQIRGRLFAPLHTNHPLGSIHALVYEVWRLNGHTLYVHSGSQSHNECFMALSLEQDAGIFWCFEGFSPKAASSPKPLSQRELAPEFLAPLVGGAPPAMPAAGGWKSYYGRYVGEYLSLRRYHHGVGRLDTFLNPPQLLFERGPKGLRERRAGDLVEVAPGAFRGAGMTDQFVFFSDPETGRQTVSRPVIGSVWQQPSWRDSPRWISPLFAGALLLCLTGLLFPLWRRSGGGRGRSLGALALGTVALALAAIILKTGLVDNPFVLADDPALTVARSLSYVFGLLALWLLVGIRHDLSRGATGAARFARIHHLLLAFGGLAFTLLLANAGLLSFTLY